MDRSNVSVASDSSLLLASGSRAVISSDQDLFQHSLNQQKSESVIRTVSCRDPRKVGKSAFASRSSVNSYLLSYPVQLGRTRFFGPIAYVFDLYRLVVLLDCAPGNAFSSLFWDDTSPCCQPKIPVCGHWNQFGTFRMFLAYS